ncbi:MAG TPA: cytochrome c oxidase accessory protein CcoG [Fluviicoccus sp.]|nr:cytochrome c oxidase accessory protein CcoG [Fluviicoccus sp.]
MSQKIPTKDRSPDPVNVIDPSEEFDLYAKRKKIHPRTIKGIFQTIRNITMSGMLLAYFALPWVMWEGHQALLFDLPHRQFNIFGFSFAPQDFFFLSWMLIMGAFGLFVVTVFAGRVFCGYVCPQTTWTRVFMWIEKITEGERNARIKLDKAELSAGKVGRRLAKHSLWLLVAFATGFSFVGYFTPIRDLAWDFGNGQLDGWGYFFIGLFTVFTYMNAGWLREQVCFYMCPYGRFQSVMFDKDTLIISYDHERGEPRGALKQSTAENPLGDCVDCSLCVQVCPTGIDIRDGLQFQCIQCAACVDACDSVMDKLNKPRGLVRYTTEHILEEHKPYHWMRPRLIGYTTVFIAVFILFIYALATRVPLTVEVLRDRSSMYRESSEGMIENAYTLRILNKAQATHTYRVSIEDGEHITLLPVKDVEVKPGEVVSVPVTLQANPAELHKTKYEVEFEVEAVDVDEISKETKTVFLAPRS